MDTPKKTFTRTQWVVALCSALCLAVMAGVLVLAKQPPAQGRGHGEAAESLSNAELFGKPEGRRGARPKPKLDFSGCGQLDPDKPPKVEFEMSAGKLQLGALKQGVKLEKRVLFRSVGSGPLCIVKVSTGCGCLKARLVGDKKRYEPGEEGEISLAIDTTGKVGTLRKRVTLTTNDLLEPLRSFMVEMDVSAGLVAEPRYIQFGNVPPNTAAQRTLLLRTSKEDDKWEVKGVSGGRKMPGGKTIKYTFEVEPVEDPRFFRYKLRVTHPGFGLFGPLRDTLVIATTHPDRPRLEVSAHINVVPRILSRSRVISLGFVRSGVPRAPMRARIQAGAPGVVFKILRVEILPPAGQEPRIGGVGFTAWSGQDDRGWWVDVKYDGKSRQAGLFEALLVIHTDDEKQPEVRVPVRATVQTPKTPTPKAGTPKK